MRHPEINRLTSLLNGADAGHYALPAAVLDARAMFAKLAGAVCPVKVTDSRAAQRDLVDALVIAAGKPGEPTWPAPGKVTAALESEEAAQVWTAAHESALQSAADLVVASVLDNADAIIVGSLRPAVEAVLVEAAAAAPAFAPVAELDDRQLLAAKDEHRDAALALDALAARYAAIREAQRVLSAGRVARDVEGLWAEFANLAELYGNRWPGRAQQSWRPGPTAARARIAWLAVGDPAEPVKPEVVMLTPAERDALWIEAYGARHGLQASTPATVGLIGAAHDEGAMPAGTRMVGHR